MTSRPQTAPSTEAGRRLDRWIEKAVVTSEIARADYRIAVLECESEARQQGRDRLQLLEDVAAKADAVKDWQRDDCTPNSGCGLAELRTVLAALSEQGTR